MIIAIDEVIPYAQAAFSGAGDLRLFSGRTVRPEDIRDADALIVRSVTRVDADLLEGSSVRFVGTATIGTDHLDLAQLAARGIRWANAAGSNAGAVAEYVISALLAMAECKPWDLAGKSIAIIGAGRIGSQVETKVAALGMRPMLCDPPLLDSTGDLKYGRLDDVLHADIFTLHVPLTTSGPYPTFHMFDRRILSRLSDHQFLINTSRGPVISSPDLKTALREGRLGGAVLDVWEEEPGIDCELLSMVDLGTAHIAGSSREGKARGTATILEEMCRFFGLAVNWDVRATHPEPEILQPAPGAEGEPAVWSVVRQAYDIRRDDAKLRRFPGLAKGSAAVAFDSLRNGYPLRPEFSHFTVEQVEDTRLGRVFRELGFSVPVPSGVHAGRREGA